MGVRDAQCRFFQCSNALGRNPQLFKINNKIFKHLLMHSICTNELKKHNRKFFYFGTSLGNNLIV